MITETIEDVGALRDTAPHTAPASQSDTASLVPLGHILAVGERAPVQQQRMVKTYTNLQHLKAIAALWRELGCPQTGFWQGLKLDLRKIQEMD